MTGRVVSRITIITTDFPALKQSASLSFFRPQWLAKNPFHRGAGTVTGRAGRIKRHAEILEKLAFTNLLLTAVIESSPDGILVANNINKILDLQSTIP